MQTSSNSLSPETDSFERSLLDRAFNGPDDDGAGTTRATSWLESESFVATPVVTPDRAVLVESPEPHVDAPCAAQPVDTETGSWLRSVAVFALIGTALVVGFIVGRQSGNSQSEDSIAPVPTVDEVEVAFAAESKPNNPAPVDAFEGTPTTESVIRFRTNSVQLDDAALGVVSTTVELALADLERQIVVIAAPDPGAVGALGQELARLRSLELREALVGGGIDESRIQLTIVAEPLRDQVFGSTTTVFVLP